MKKYMDIVRLGHKSTTNVLNIGDEIIIQEKIDGANASFKLEDDKIKVFSRKTELNLENNLRGFYNYAITIDYNKLNNDYIYFGEWSCKHKITYPLESTNKFYLYDIYSISNEVYLPISIVKSEAQKLNLNLIPIFYEGEYISFEHLQSFIGKTELGGKKGEGIIVKNIKYNDKYGNQLFVKLVSDEFAEIQKQKLPKDPYKKLIAEQKFINTYLTSARVEKILHKLVDENIIDENYGLEDMSIILKSLGLKIYEDLIKEEIDYLPENYEQKNLRKAIGSKIPQIVKEIIKEKEK
jgi:hypothetical protein